MPEKLERCVDDVMAKGTPKDSAYPICVDSTGEKPHKEVKEKSYPWSQCIDDNKDKGMESAKKICGSIKAKYGETKKVTEKINANRQVPYFNPPIKNNPVEPKIDKTTKGIGGQVGKIDSTKNPMNPTLWKQILDSQLKRNVKEPRY